GSQYIAFQPETEADFCTLSNNYPENSYRVTIKGPIILKTTYGDPSEQLYGDVNGGAQLPEKKYLIKVADSSCGRPPEDYELLKAGITSNASKDDRYGQLVDGGFPIVNTKGATGNFPTNAFNGATFRLQVKTGKGSNAPLANGGSGW